MKAQVTMNEAFEKLGKTAVVRLNAIVSQCGEIEDKHAIEQFNDLLKKFNTNSQDISTKLRSLEKMFHQVTKNINALIMKANIVFKEKDTILKQLIKESHAFRDEMEIFKNDLIASTKTNLTHQSTNKNSTEVSFNEVFDLKKSGNFCGKELAVETQHYMTYNSKYIVLRNTMNNNAASNYYPVLFSLDDNIEEIATAWDLAIQFINNYKQEISGLKLLHPFYMNAEYPDNHIVVYFNAVDGDRVGMTQIHKHYSDIVKGLIDNWNEEGIKGNYQLFEDGITTTNWELHAHLISEYAWDETVVFNGLMVDKQQAQFIELYNSLMFSLEHELLPVIEQQSNEVRNPFQYLHLSAILGWKKLLSSLVDEHCLQPNVALVLLLANVQQAMVQVKRGLAISDSSKTTLLEVLEQDYNSIKGLLDTFNQSSNRRLRVAPRKAKSLLPELKPVVVKRQAA